LSKVIDKSINSELIDTSAATTISFEPKKITKPDKPVEKPLEKSKFQKVQQKNLANIQVFMET
jgi:hypothetical protein